MFIKMLFIETNGQLQHWWIELMMCYVSVRQPNQTINTIVLNSIFVEMIQIPKLHTEMSISLQNRIRCDQPAKLWKKYTVKMNPRTIIEWHQLKTKTQHKFNCWELKKWIRINEQTRKRCYEFDSKL